MNTKIPKPQVSIIICYFKKKKFFKKTINSIINQTYRSFEVIVIYDDTDKSELNFVKKTLNKLPRYKIVINKKNIGAGLSRNKGIHFAKGKFISFCDADDLWHKNKLKVQISFMLKKKLNFSHTSYTIINNYGKTIGYFKIKNKLNYSELLKSCDIATSSVVINKKIFKQKFLFSNFKTKEDYCLWLKIIKKYKELYGINDNLLFWRSSKNSLSDSLFQKLLDGFKVYYINENYNAIISTYFVIRLSLFALIKKFAMYR
tara:strand:+ start:1379 stop:2155 length:777 start_codon:yes stop_codon:yes gene_type:complete